MEELEIKKNELIKKLEKVESNIADLKDKINEAIKKEEDYVDSEMQLYCWKETKKEIEEKINILNKAQDILEGIGL